MGGAPAIVWLRPGVGYSAPAAASMRRLERELGREHDCNSSYRDYDEQKRMFDAWNRYVASGYNPRLKPNHSRAIDPDKSSHCAGTGDDSDDWMTPGYIALAARHGWIRTASDDPTERHHFEYQWWNDQHRNDPDPEEEMNGTQEAKLDALGKAVTDLATNLQKISEALLNGHESNLSKPAITTAIDAAVEVRDRIRGPKANRERNPIDILQDTHGQVEALRADMEAERANP